MACMPEFPGYNLWWIEEFWHSGSYRKQPADAFIKQSEGCQEADEEVDNIGRSRSIHSTDEVEYQPFARCDLQRIEYTCKNRATSTHYSLFGEKGLCTFILQESRSDPSSAHTPPPQTNTHPDIVGPKCVNLEIVSKSAQNAIACDCIFGIKAHGTHSTIELNHAMIPPRQWPWKSLL